MCCTVSISSLMAISIGLLFLITAIQQVVLAQDSNITNMTGTKNFQTEMNVNIPEEYLSGIIGALIGFVATFLGAIVKYYHDIRLKDIELRNKYDIDLRNKRIEAYTKLWEYLKPLAFFSSKEKYTYDELEKLSEELTTWYYGLGGLVMSSSSQKFYVQFQKEITQKMEIYSKISRTAGLPPEKVQELKDKASEFKSKTIQDVGTRKESDFEYA
jgi:hypothetical protein